MKPGEKYLHQITDQRSNIWSQQFSFLLFAALLLLTCLKGGFFGAIGLHPLNLVGFKIPVGQFVLLYLTCWILCMALFLFFPRRISATAGCLLILMVSAGCRLALLPHQPSDDVNRYLWEGKMVLEGINPYRFAPADESLVHLAAEDHFHSGINHPHVPAIYPPLMPMIFSLVGRISYHPMAFKVTMALFDLATLGFLLNLLYVRRLDLRWGILYAFNPVVLFSFAGQGHMDAVQNFFLISALWCYDRKSWKTMFLLAGLAVQSKYIAAVALPYLLRRENLRHAWILVAATGLPYLPFAYADGIQVFSEIFRFAGDYAFNGPVHEILHMVSGSRSTATWVCLALLVAVLCVGSVLLHPWLNRRYHRDPVPGWFFSLGATLLFLPTIHFWYVSWIVPLLPLLPKRSWNLLCLTISGYFVANGVYLQTGHWVLPGWAKLWEWVPFGLVLSVELYFACRRFLAPIELGIPRSVSVVIPALNEEKEIAGCIRCIKRDETVKEVIVVDGGSRDQTVVQANSLGAKVILPPESGLGGGRGGLIHSGIMASTGDIVAVVHADTRITRPVFGEILRLLAFHPALVGGAVGSRFDAGGWRFRVLETVNDFRAAILGISFGDQVQFFRRAPVLKSNLFPAIPLMEDVEFSIRLHRLGRQAFLFGNAMVSARRWKSFGFAHTWTVLRLFATYLIQRNWGNAEDMTLYNRYYPPVADRRQKPLQ
jgi:hypothetical protein